LKTNICILFFGLITSFLWAQNTQIAKQQNQTSVEQCAAMDILEYHINNNPLIEQQRKVVETHIDQVLSNKKVSKKIKEVITIPVSIIAIRCVE